MSLPKPDKLPKDSLDKLSVDVSWIRVYVLLRATSDGMSIAHVVADLARRGFECDRAFVSGIMRALEKKGYLARIATPNGRRSDTLYVLTARGRCATHGLQTKIRELFAKIRSSGSSEVSAAD